MLPKLDRYILSEFWLPLVSGAGIITGVWLGIDKFKDVFKLLARSGASFSTGLVVLGLEIPQILAVTMPIAMLLAAFLAFQKLSGQSELLAMRAAGASFTRIMKPVFILGLLGIAFTFIVSEFVVPFTTPFAQKIYTLALYKDPIATNGIDGFSYFEKDSKGAIRRIFYVRKFKNDLLRDVVILDFSKKNLSMIHTAKKGQWDPVKGGWVLQKGSSSYIKSSTTEEDLIEAEADNYEGWEDTSTESMHLVTNFEKTLIPSSLNPHEILKKLTKLNELNFIGLYNFIKLHENDRLYTSDLNSVKAQFYNKFAYPVACLILALIGACLGIVGRRRVINWGYIALGLVVFVFYMSQTIFDSYADSGKIEPAIAVWIPNLILGAIAASVYFYRANK